MIAVLMFIVPPEKELSKRREFVTSLISPQELESREPVHVPPAPLGIPLPPRAVGVPKIQKPAPEIKGLKRQPAPHDASPGYLPALKGDSRYIPPPSSRLDSGLQEGVPGGIGTGPAARGKIPEPDDTGPSLKEKLFDKGIINDLAKRNIEKENKKDTSFTFDTSEYKFLIYNKRLKERIESIWVYPPDAASQGIYGDLVIRFTIKKNGQLGSVEIVRTSGHKNLDDAAIRALKDGAPYWPLPNEWGMEAYTIVGHFVYTIYGYYIR
jgi:protein TonB